MAKITDIHCPSCGAPAHFDIVQQSYLCSYCGGKVAIGDAVRQKQGFRAMRAEILRTDVKRFRLFSTVCDGCGAEVMFEEGEALTSCAFCGRSLVRKEYLNTDGLPESVIPFAITPQEAQERIMDWCRHNRHKPEAKQLKRLIPQLRGFYLPYELVRGPVHMKASRMDSQRVYDCEGFLNDAFINRSKQLDNLLLDGMEPFDTDRMADFDFAYVAGHRVKISDLSDDAVEARASAEARAVYTPSVRKTLETNAVEISADVSGAVRYPVLLPVYYLCEGELTAAVNGQTGKVSVRALKESRYHFAPWWFKAILATLALSGILFGAFWLLGMELPLALFATGIPGFYFFMVTMCVYSDTAKNKFSVEAGKEIYTSGEQTFARERGGLVPNEKALKRKISQPVWFEMIDGARRPVILRFTTPVRIIRMLAISLIATFLPVIIALLVNGFDFGMLHFGGSAVWFCIAVPVVPIYLLKFGIVELHENPWICYRADSGRIKRYRSKKKKFKIDGELIKTILLFTFVPPASLAVWAGIAAFCVMVYLTAGYGW